MYSVTVTQKPLGPSQTCAVSGGAGQITGNVTNVLVTCTTDTFSVGGTVTGMLAGASISLQLNSLPSLPVQMNGAFALQHVPSGTAYTVSVAGPPPGQTCIVTGGSGTVTSMAVTSVTVNCDSAKVSLGGSVSGLVGGALVLTDANAGTVTVSGNGSFAFPTPTAAGTMYSVSITQPTNPTQTCIATNAMGVIGPNASSAVTVTCTVNTYLVGGLISGLAPGATIGLTLTYVPLPPVGVQVTTSKQIIGAPAGGQNAFGFAGVPSGSTFTLVVSAQPAAPSQTCTVTSGATGMVTSSAVGVLVSCATNAFPVGGTISGLAGTGLGLSLTVSGPIASQPGPVTVGAPSTTFSFPNIPSGDSFLLSVTSQPINPAQNCVVQAGTGTVGSAAFGTLAVQCTTVTWPVTAQFMGLRSVILETLTTGGSSVTQPVGSGPGVPFSLRVIDGQGYNITFVNPSSPMQTCIPRPVMGIATAAVNVTITCSP
jgi:hypothetical protein